MADETKNIQTIETPPDVKKLGEEPAIFAMPAKYRGAARSVSPAPPPAVVAPTKPVPKTMVAVPPPPPPPLPKRPTPPKPAAAPGMAGSTKVLLLAGAIIVAAFAIVGVIVFLSLKQPVPAVEKPIVKPETPGEEVTPGEETPGEEVTPGEETPGEEVVSPFPQELTPGRDTDSDGLTDKEETLYGTNPRLPDTDLDGFLDGNEVFHRYNPNGTAPGTLLEAGLASLHHAVAVYELLYPSSWQWQADAAQPLAGVFLTGTGETVTVTAEPKDGEPTLLGWYLAAADKQALTDEVEFVTKNGYDAIRTKDDMTTFIDAGSYVLTLTYQVVGKNTVDYLQTFEMMVNSVVIRPLTPEDEAALSAATVAPAPSPTVPSELVPVAE